MLVFLSKSERDMKNTKEGITNHRMLIDSDATFPVSLVSA